MRRLALLLLLGLGGCAVPRRFALLPLLPAPRAEAREPRGFQATISESGLEDWAVKDYEAMRDDVPRTESFARAIERRLKGREATVLDIGTGPFALLAVIAAKAGAKKVYAIEKCLRWKSDLAWQAFLMDLNVVLGPAPFEEQRGRAPRARHGAARGPGGPHRGHRGRRHAGHAAGAGGFGGLGAHRQHRQPGGRGAHHQRCTGALPEERRLRSRDLCCLLCFATKGKSLEGHWKPVKNLLTL